MRKTKEIIRDENIILLSIFLLSLALRISYLLVVKEDVLVLEEFSYFDIGADLAEGKGFGLKRAQFAPLYPLFLAPIYFLFGEFKAEVAIKAIQLVLGSFSSVLIFLAARGIFNVKVGLISAFIFAFYDGMFFLNVHLLPENLIIPLELLLLLFLLRSYQGKMEHILDKNIINMAFSGLLTGLLFLVAPLTSVLIPFLILWIVLFLPKRLLISLLFLLLIGLTLCPWVIRNHLLIDSNTKEIFFKYNYPYGVSRLHLYKEKEAEPDLSEIFAFVKKNPGKYLDFFLEKLCFNLKNFLFSEKIWFEAATQKPGIFVTPIPLISWKMLSLFGLLGVFLALKLWPRTSLLYFFCMAWLASILILFAGFPRFRLPLVPFFIIFSSFGVYSIFRLVGDAHHRRGALYEKIFTFLAFSLSFS